MNTKVLLLMVLTGIVWGTWPMLMQRSGLGGNISSAVFAGVAFLCVVPFALRQGVGQLAQTNWKLALVAGILGGIGLLMFNGGLAQTSANKVGTAVITMTLVQIAVPALYQVVMTGELSLKKVAGALTAIATVKLLS